MKESDGKRVKHFLPLRCGFGERFRGIFAKVYIFFISRKKRTVLGWLSWLRAVLLFCDDLAVAW